MLGSPVWLHQTTHQIVGRGRIHELHEFVDHRLPLILLFSAFLLTFLATRLITRLIRAGRGPFHNNVAGGVHIHHALPGIILTILGAFTSVSAAGRPPVAEISAVMIGVGASLVLDEFALILHLQDVYWSREGQLSVQVVALTVAGLGLLVLGFRPFSEGTQSTGHAVFLTVLVVHGFCLLMCIAKGKYSMAVIGVFLPPVAWWGAARLGTPTSRWARRYGPKKLQRSMRRHQAFERRWGAWGLTLSDLVAGTPTEDSPSTPTDASMGGRR